MRICLLGSQGTGKSTLAKLFRDEYEIIDGIARKCIAQGCNSSENGDANSQRIIFRDYLKALSKESDFISTRSLIDVVAYTGYLAKSSSDLQELYSSQLQELKEWWKNNPDIVICYIPIEFEIEVDGVRSTDKKYQIAIDKEMRDLLYKLNAKYYHIDGSINEREQLLWRIIDEIGKYGVEDHIIKDF